MAHIAAPLYKQATVYTTILYLFKGHTMRGAFWSVPVQHIQAIQQLSWDIARCSEKALIDDIRYIKVDLNKMTLDVPLHGDSTLLDKWNCPVRSGKCYIHDGMVSIPICNKEGIYLHKLVYGYDTWRISKVPSQGEWIPLDETNIPKPDCIC